MILIKLKSFINHFKDIFAFSIAMRSAKAPSCGQKEKVLQANLSQLFFTHTFHEIFVKFNFKHLVTFSKTDG